MQKHYIESLIPYYSNMMPCVLRQYAHSETYQKHPEKGSKDRHHYIRSNLYTKEIKILLLLILLKKKFTQKSCGGFDILIFNI